MIRKCDICGKKYEARQTDLDRGYAKHCSRSCAATTREMLRRGDGDLLEALRDDEPLDFDSLEDMDYQEDY